MTPEGRVKRAVSALLRSYGPAVYYEMPVPGGFGASGLDYIGAACGRAFAVETKRPGARPTARQEGTISRMRAAGMAVFVVAGADDMTALKEWLDDACAGVGEGAHGGGPGGA